MHVSTKAGLIVPALLSSAGIELPQTESALHRREIHPGYSGRYFVKVTLAAQLCFPRSLPTF